MAWPSPGSPWTARCCRISRSTSPRRSRRSPRRPRPLWRPELTAGSAGLQRALRVALGDLRPAECRERQIHGAGFIPVLPVARAHLALVSPFPRHAAGHEVRLAFLLDGGAELDIAARGQ